MTAGRPTSGGYTLIELLIVIVVLGVLATVVVLAVRGITDRGDQSAVGADARTIQSAQESYMALHGAYASESELVAAGLLRTESDLHDVELQLDGSYVVHAVATTASAVVGDATPPSAADGGHVAESIVYGGRPALSYGTGPKQLVFLETKNPAARAQYDAWVLANPPIPDTQFVFVTGGLDTIGDVEDLLEQASATAWVGAYEHADTWTPGVVTNLFYLRATGAGTQRSTPIDNVIQWDTGSESVSVVVDNFVANY